MSNEFLALKLPADQDLRAFSRFLWQQPIPHRISEQGGELLLWVAHEQQVAQVRACFETFEQSEHTIQEPVVFVHPPQRNPLASAREIPVTLTLLVLSLLGAALPWLNFEWVNQLTFYQVSTVDGETLQFNFPAGQYWRLITPIFLHFGVLHITFNALWVWELGRRIERLQGGFQLLGVTLLIGVGSNLAQAAVTEAGIFGGMSGVIYGYLGYMVAWSWLRPERSFQLPRGIVIFMLAWLLLCIVGFASLLGFGAIANAAHVGGLLMGALLGLLAAVVGGRDRG